MKESHDWKAHGAFPREIRMYKCKIGKWKILSTSSAPRCICKCAYCHFKAQDEREERFENQQCSPFTRNFTLQPVAHIAGFKKTNRRDVAKFMGSFIEKISEVWGWENLRRNAQKTYAVFDKLHVCEVPELPMKPINVRCGCTPRIQLSMKVNVKSNKVAIVYWLSHENTLTKSCVNLEAEYCRPAGCMLSIPQVAPFSSRNIVAEVNKGRRSASVRFLDRCGMN